MPSILIKSIGPVKNTGKLELNTVNLFIGKQSTGKSTILKILSHCRWVEKCICIGKRINGKGVKYAYTHYYRFVQELMKFYRMDASFFNSDSEIIYEGDNFIIEFKGGIKSNAKIEVVKNAAPYNAKLSFIPSERNLIAAIKDIESWYRSKDFDLLFNFIFEWDEIRETFTSEKALPLVVAPKLEYYYDKKKGERLRMVDCKREFEPFFASSGVQSALPLEAMVASLVNAVGTKANFSMSELTQIVNAILEQNDGFSKDSAESKIARDLLVYKGISLFVEEPEQNLFPEAQAKLLYKMVAAVKNANEKAEISHSMLAVTTHSPYILSALNVLMAASVAFDKSPVDTHDIIPADYILPTGSISAFCVSEEGTVYDIVDHDIYMVDGTYLDAASQIVEDNMDSLNRIICD